MLVEGQSGLGLNGLCCIRTACKSFLDECMSVVRTLGVLHVHARRVAVNLTALKTQLWTRDASNPANVVESSQTGDRRSIGLVGTRLQVVLVSGPGWRDNTVVLRGLPA